MAKCPVCKRPLSYEMLPIGNEKKETKRKVRMSAILPQVITWAIDFALRAHVGSGRGLYLTCNNEDCPACYRMINSKYFKDTPFGPVLVGDVTGFILDNLRSRYRKKMSKKDQKGYDAANAKEGNAVHKKQAADAAEEAKKQKEREEKDKEIEREARREAMQWEKEKQNKGS